MQKTVEKILVVCKKSSLQLAREHNNVHILDLVEKGDSTVSKMVEADKEHNETLTALRQAVESKPWTVIFRNRAEVRRAEHFDLVITLGGDGTFLWASKKVPSTIPMLGLNSDPSTSVGFYTSGSKKDIPLIIQKIEAGLDFSQVTVQRLQVKVNGLVIHSRILNDVLFAANHPAAMTNYILTCPTPQGSITEEQRSSGIWISTPTGSTGANLSAGGWVLPIWDERAQFVVREPMKSFVWGAEYHWVHGLFDKGKTLKIVNKTRKAILALDGTTNSFKITTGDTVEISHSPESLTILGK